MKTFVNLSADDLKLKRFLFAEQVRIWRARLGMTQQNFAESAGICRRALQKAEKGEAISLITELKLCKFADERGILHASQPLNALG